MKKIMMAVAIVCAAVIGNAATVQWNATGLKDGTGTAVAAKDMITGYIYSITAGDYATYAAMDAATLSQTIGAAFVAGELGIAEASAKNTYASRSGAALSLQGVSDYGAGDTAYGLILYVDAANEMYMANVAAAPFASAQNVKVSDLSNTLGGTGSGLGSTAWAAAVPEPTSGLLLLLGMAGLALKRKHA